MPSCKCFSKYRWFARSSFCCILFFNNSRSKRVFKLEKVSASDYSYTDLEHLLITSKNDSGGIYLGVNHVSVDENKPCSEDALNITIPDDIRSGTYFIKISTDPYFEVEESDESNNVKYIEIQVEEPSIENINYLEVASKTLYKGDANTIEIALNNSTDIRGFEFDIEVSTSGFSLDTSNIVFQNAPSDFNISMRKISTLGNSTYKVIGYASDIIGIPEESNATIQIPVTIDASVAEGQYEFPIKEGVSIADSTNNNVATLAPSIGVITVKNTILGDINLDQKVNIFDILSQVDFIFGLNPSPFHYAAADVSPNGSGINIFDILGVQDIIFGIAPEPIAESNMKVLTGANYLTIQDTTLNAGDSENIELILSNDTPVRGLQFDITFPDAFEFDYANTELTQELKNLGLALNVQPINEGTQNEFRFVILNLFNPNATLAVADRSILSLPITISNDAESGTFDMPIEVESISNANASQNIASTPPRVGVITISNSTLPTDQFVFDDDIILYPNPVTDTVILKNPSNLVINTIKISDILGTNVLNIDTSNSSSTIDINLDGLSSGVYFIKINTENGVILKKIVKL